MDNLLLATALKSRASYLLITKYADLKKHTRQFQIVWDLVANYYKLDENAQSVLPEVLAEYIRQTVRNDKHADQFIGLINDAAALDVSEVNVREVVLTTKRRELADELAVALTNGKDTPELLEAYEEICRLTDIEQLEKTEAEILDSGSVDELLEQAANRTGLLAVYPKAINDRLDGGLGPGDHVVVFARPETGKTAICVNLGAGFARQEASGLYIGNEDRPQRIMMRFISNLTGLTKRQILDNPKRATEVAMQNGLGHVRIVSLAPGTPGQIEELIEKFKPKWLIVDQIRNLAMKADNRVNQLEAAAAFVRNMAKKHQLIGISVTQAGDSAEGKEILTMGDVDYSNTGIPAAADVMIGMGVTAALEAQGLRMISLPKNKIGGEHASFVVKLVHQLSRVLSVE